MICDPQFVTMLSTSHTWFLSVYLLCFIFPIYVAFITYIEILLAKNTFFEKFTMFSTFQQSLWGDYVEHFFNWYISVMLYHFVRSVQSLLMFFLTKLGVVENFDKQIDSPTCLNEEIKRLTLETIRLCNMAKTFSEECKRLNEHNDKLTKDNLHLYREYATSIRTLEFLNAKIGVHLKKKSRKDFEEWLVVLESETRKANQEEEDRTYSLRDEVS